MLARLIPVVVSVAVLSAEAQAGFGSIYYDSSSGGHGESYGYSSPERAKAEALSTCREYGNLHCKIAMPTFDSCGAVTVDSTGEAYWGIGQNSNLAAGRAMSACKKDSTGCEPLVSICNPWETAPVQVPAIIPYHPPSSPNPEPQPIPCPPNTQRGLGGCYHY
jgi:hypothetical protein